MWVQMGKKSIYYGSVSSLSFRCLIGGNFGDAKNGINARWVHPKKFSSKTFLGTLSVVFCERGADHACVGSFAERQRAERSKYKWKDFFYGCEAVKVVMLDRCGLWYVKNGRNARCCCAFTSVGGLTSASRSKSQHGARGMGKKSIYYGSVSSLSFRFFVFLPIPFYSVFLFFDAGVMIYPANVVKLLNSSVFRAVIRKQYGKNC